jgi:hypothetical protein
MTEMGDESFFEIQALKPSNNVSSSPWLTQNVPNVQRQQQQTINQMANVNVGQDASFLARYYFSETADLIMNLGLAVP